METLLGITGIVFFFGCIITVFYLSYLGRRKRFETILELVEKTGDINPEMTKVLNHQGGGPVSDFRKALIWIAIGIPLTIGLALEDGLEAAVFGLIPELIGVAYLIVRKFGYDQPK